MVSSILLESKKSLTIPSIFAGRKEKSDEGGVFAGIGRNLLVMTSFLQTTSSNLIGKKTAIKGCLHLRAFCEYQNDWFYRRYLKGLELE